MNSTPKNETDSQDKRRQARIETEERILRAAESSFAQSGFRGTTMEQIASAAGMSKQNMIYYYPSKEAIYHAVLKHILDLWLEHMQFEARGNETPKEIIESYIMGKLEMARDYPDASKVFALEVIAGAPVLKDALQNELKPLFDRDIALVESWIDAGQLRKFDPRHFFFTVWAASQTYADFATQVSLMMGKQQLEEQDYQDAASFLAGMVLRGLAPE
ncbi:MULTISPECIES: TetR family transcriptional regulator C-terminal domain-containing protein [Aliagarivorans]|uniref:TetR family transcriptional regulator C-terminal domain-containing protein n=1 Tax=Aliagarivorans TaxID=882379 RepID=UPI0004160E1C|nr:MULTISPECIES: TetR family transcriptional regulator C-terminal domain-containing protein [Aliagarivorans]